MGRANTPTAFGLSHPLPPQRVVLQVDATRQHDYRRWLILGFVLLAAALFNGSQRSAPLSHGYRLEKLQRQRADAETEGRRLRGEIASLASPAVIQRLAVGRLHLVPPGRDDAMVIERVVPPQPPPSSVVASR
jgi:cell division protein FtsL